MLQLTNLKKTYGQRVILDIRDLILPEGAHWVKGNNGSGKTSLMKIIAGINPFEGNVILNGIGLIEKPLEYRQLVSFAEAEPLFPGFLTGWDLIRFVQQTRKEKDDVIEALVEYFDILSFLPYAVGTYSSGMVKKLSLLLPFIGSVKLVLLDEPLITLEDSFLPKLFSLIKERQAQGVSFLLSSHQSFHESQFIPTSKIIVENQTVTLIES
ncbi:MAG: ATP-binding cassette domain-containing protein [Cyclobacteriaceae bacterium]|nr:ATP-binding cassette domain-containing protein [Cyclobacteriaceae bacterium]